MKALLNLSSRCAFSLRPFRFRNTDIARFLFSPRRSTLRRLAPLCHIIFVTAYRFSLASTARRAPRRSASSPYIYLIIFAAACLSSLASSTRRSAPRFASSPRFVSLFLFAATHRCARMLAMCATTVRLPHDCHTTAVRLPHDCRTTATVIYCIFFRIASGGERFY